jgi:hypothetical protein
VVKLAVVAPLAAAALVGLVSARPARTPDARTVPIPNARPACSCIRAIPTFHGKLTLVPMHRIP